MKKDLLPCAILVAFWGYLFREILIGNHLLYGNDFNAFYLGMKQFLFTEVHQHHSIPYWNPYILGGMPFWAHFESTIFYPLGFLFWILPPARAYGYTMFLHLVLAALFMYALSRTLGIGRAGAFVAGAVFSCNGFVMALLFLGHMSPVMSYPWLPLVILFLYRAINSERSYRGAVTAGVFWGIQILAGAPQDAFYTYGAAVVLGLIYIVHPAGYSSRIRIAICLLVLFVAGAGLSALQVIPGMELIHESVRSALDSYQDVTSRSLPPQGVITAVLPHFFWDPGTNFTWLENMPFSMPQENLYTGILPLFLVLLVPLRRFKNVRLDFFVCGLAFFGLLLAMGYHTPLYKFAYYLPGFDHFRSPTRIIVLWVFAMALLAGKGMDLLTSLKPASKARLGIALGLVIFITWVDILVQRDQSFIVRIFAPFVLSDALPARIPEAELMIKGEVHRFLLIGGAICLLSLFVLRKSSLSNLRADALTTFLCGLLLVDLATANGGSIQYNDPLRTKALDFKTDLEAAIGRDKGLYRVGSFGNSLGPNFEMALGYQTVGGFTALIPERYYEYINYYAEGSLPEGWQYFFYGQHPRGIMMDLLNVKYEIDRPAKRVFRRDTCLPRAFVVPGCMTSPREEVLKVLTLPDFDPAQTVILETGNCPAPIQTGNSAKAEVEWLDYRPDEIRIRVNSVGPGFLFVSEMYYPGWKAFVDKQNAEIFRGNYLFRVIPVQGGEHIVDLQFSPLSIKMGIGITISAMVLIGLYAICSRRKTRKSSTLRESHV